MRVVCEGVGVCVYVFERGGGDECWHSGRWWRGMHSVSLILGAVRLCKWSVRLRARLSRLLTGRRVHNMSPTQPARQPAQALTENRGVGWGGVGDREGEDTREYESQRAAPRALSVLPKSKEFEATFKNIAWTGTPRCLSASVESH